MAAPSIVSTATTNGTTATTTPVVNLPAGIVAGNLLFVAYRCASAGGITWPAGWTEIYDDSIDLSNDQRSAAWRKAGVGEPATITLNSGNGKFTALAWQISGAADPTITPPELGSATGLDANPDPPPLAPSWGSQATLWLALGGWEGEATSPPTFPASYTLNQIAASSGIAGSDASNCRMAGAARQLTAASENPGSFTISTALFAWTASTIAIRPDPRRGLVYWVELPVPDAPRIAIAYFAELEIPTAPREGRVYQAEFEVPTAPRQGFVYLAELETPPAPRRIRVYMAHLQVPPGSSADDGDNDAFLRILDRRDSGHRRIER